VLSDLQKHRLLLLPLITGLILVIGAWWLSYPLSIGTVNDVVFNHTSYLYWIGFPLLLTSLFALSVFSENYYVKWIAVVGIVLTVYSLSYFYFLLPGSDQATFRGLTEYFIKTGDLDPSKSTHSYFQWPSYFLLNDMAVSIAGISLWNFEFIQYALLGILFATTIYVSASRAHRHTGFLAVAAFFVIMFPFFNYQDVPFSLAFGILLATFMLETSQRNWGSVLVTIVLFTGMTFLHPYVPLFFVLYLFISWMITRRKESGYLAIITLSIFLVVQLIQAPLSFISNLRGVFTYESDFPLIVGQITAPVYGLVDQIAQVFSRVVTIAMASFCFIGFIILMIRKKLRISDKAIFLTGLCYSIAGVVFFILGTRAYPLIALPICLGASYFLESKFRRITISLFLILLTLFTFVIVHTEFFATQIMYQTKTDYVVENFFINHFNSSNPILTLMHVRVMLYVQAKEPIILNTDDDTYSQSFPRFKEYGCIVYTFGLGISLSRYNYSIDSLVSQENLDLIYNSGASCIAVRSGNIP
jgi:hypothetical protein